MRRRRPRRPAWRSGPGRPVELHGQPQAGDPFERHERDRRPCHGPRRRQAGASWPRGRRAARTPATRRGSTASRPRRARRARAGRVRSRRAGAQSARSLRIEAGGQPARPEHEGAGEHDAALTAAKAWSAESISNRVPKSSGSTLPASRRRRWRGSRPPRARRRARARSPSRGARAPSRLARTATGTATIAAVAGAEHRGKPSPSASTSPGKRRCRPRVRRRPARVGRSTCPSAPATASISTSTIPAARREGERVEHGRRPYRNKNRSCLLSRCSPRPSSGPAANGEGRLRGRSGGGDVPAAALP